MQYKVEEVYNTLSDTAVYHTFDERFVRFEDAVLFVQKQAAQDRQRGGSPSKVIQLAAGCFVSYGIITTLMEKHESVGPFVVYRVKEEFAYERAHDVSR